MERGREGERDQRQIFTHQDKEYLPDYADIALLFYCV